MSRLAATSNLLVPGWYPLGMSAEFDGSPRRYVLEGIPLVGFRSAGAVVVLVDRCPHRNVPLSGGRLVGTEIECPYHGWRFDAGGRCTAIPGRLEPPRHSHCVTAYPTVLHQGIVFVGVDVAPDTAPFHTDEQADPSYARLVRAVTFPGTVLSVAENALDVPHTTVLHRGLFRSGARKTVRVVMRRYRDWMEAEYIGETLPRGILSRVLAGGAGTNVEVSHHDRFVLPNVLQVEYRVAAKAHISITAYVAPVDERTTRVFAQVCAKTPAWRWLTKLLLVLVEPLARLIVRQDMAVLRAQLENIEQFGEARFMSTEADVFYAGLSRLLKEGSTVQRAGFSQSLDRSSDPREVSEISLET